MAEKNAKSKRDRKGERGASLLDKLTEAEAASVLRKLLDRHSELRAEAEAAARDMLAGISPLSVAGEIEDALLQFDYDDLNGRAGRRSCGYVEPSEAAGELLQEALDPFIDDMKRYLEAGLEEPACQFCQGILLGLYRVRGSENDILNWAPDFPGEAAGNVLEVWRETSGSDRGSAPAKGGRRLSPDFCARTCSGLGLASQAPFLRRMVAGLPSFRRIGRLGGLRRENSLFGG
jgi:hypothetical protein